MNKYSLHCKPDHCERFFLKVPNNFAVRHANVWADKKCNGDKNYYSAVKRCFCDAINYRQLFHTANCIMYMATYWITKKKKKKWWKMYATCGHTVRWKNLRWNIRIMRVASHAQNSVRMRVYACTRVETHPIQFLQLCMRFTRAFISNSSSPCFTHAFANWFKLTCF